MKAKSKAKAKDASQFEEDDPFDTDFEEWYGPSIKEGSAKNPWESASSWEGTQAAWARDVLPSPPGKVTLDELNYVHRPDEVWIPASIRIPEPETTAMIEGIDFQYKESATLVPHVSLWEVGIRAQRHCRCEFPTGPGEGVMRVRICQVDQHAHVSSIHRHNQQGQESRNQNPAEQKNHSGKDVRQRLSHSDKHCPGQPRTHRRATEVLRQRVDLS
jgi:hypothetical protein